MYCGLGFNDGIEKEVPLNYLEVNGELFGTVFYVNVFQRFNNIYDTKSDFQYTFPLPDDAQLCYFKVVAGDKIITGNIVEKDINRKKKIKKDAGGSKNIFLTKFYQNNFNIVIGKVNKETEISVLIKYIQKIKVVNGEQKIAIPPLYQSRAQEGDFFLEDYRIYELSQNKYSSKYKIVLRPQKNILDVKSTSHRVNIKEISSEEKVISFGGNYWDLDAQFNLSLKVEDSIKNRCTYYENSKGEIFGTISFVPRADRKLYSLLKRPKEFLFLLDISRSMAGIKLWQVKNALKICLRNLDAQDKFNLVAFESENHVFSKQSVDFNQGNLDSATDWIDSLIAEGGTEVLQAVKFVLDQERESGRDRVVILMTDGQFFNEQEIVEYVAGKNEGLELYAIGVDNTVNENFLKKVSAAGNGFSTVIKPRENIDERVVFQFTRINSPLFQSLKINVPGVEFIDASGGYPEKVYEYDIVFLPVILSDKPKGSIKVTAENCPPFQINIGDIQHRSDGEILEKIWGREEMDYLEKNMAEFKHDGDEKNYNFLKKILVETSKKFEIKSSETTFVGILERNGTEIYLEDCKLDSYLGDTEDEELESWLTSIRRKKGIIENENISDLAALQNADGSFGDSDSSLAERIETTREAVKELQRRENTSIYRKQIKKAEIFLEKAKG